MSVRRNVQFACGLTLFALICAVTGLMGCDLQKSASSFVACKTWSGTVLWDRVALGAAILVPAAFFWHRAVKSIS